MTIMRWLFVLGIAIHNVPLLAAAPNGVPPEDVQKIRLAVPYDAPARPKQPRKVLVFSRADGFVHDSIPWGAAAMQILGEKTGAYTATLSDDPVMFDRERLFQFDAVVMNNNCGNPIADPRRRANLLQFVRSGRGLLGIHCAAHLDWPEYTEMLGGYSISHPWNEGSRVVIKLDEPDHPLVKNFCRSSFEYTDEIFVFERFSRSDSRVLLSLDTDRTDMNKPDVSRDQDFPLCWIRRFGQGRVFYTALGHQKDVYWRPPILKHYLAGIQFALGDLEADAAPRAARNETYRPQFHFTYAKGWLSDINGLVYYKGEYHLFSQHCPTTTACDYPATHWGHAISTDLVHWRELPPAIAPDATNGPAFSGSTVVDWNNTSGLQTGEENVLVAFYTGARYILDGGRDGVICLAHSNDRGRTWTKYDRNPVVEAITHLNRDPKVFWHRPSGRWIMAITLSCGCRPDGDYRFAILSSSDLKTWREESRLDLPTGVDCPDMFELPVDGDSRNTRWVFRAGDGTHAIGTFDGKTFTPEGKIRLPLFNWEENGANGYAAQTFNDMLTSDGRRIQISWLRHGGYPGMPFNQQASIPCQLSLRSTPEGIVLCRRPVREIEQLHGKQHHWADVPLTPGENPLADLRGGLFDVQVELEPGTAGRIVFQAYGVPVVYDVRAQTLSCCGKSVPLVPVDGRIALRLLIDRTSLEIFADDGRLSMTAGFTPPGADAQLGLFAEDAPARIVSLDVFEMQSIWADPETREGQHD